MNSLVLLISLLFFSWSSAHSISKNQPNSWWKLNGQWNNACYHPFATSTRAPKTDPSVILTDFGETTIGVGCLINTEDGRVWFASIEGGNEQLDENWTPISDGWGWPSFNSITVTDGVITWETATQTNGQWGPSLLITEWEDDFFGLGESIWIDFSSNTWTIVDGVIHNLGLYADINAFAYNGTTVGYFNPQNYNSDMLLVNPWLGVLASDGVDTFYYCAYDAAPEYSDFAVIRAVKYSKENQTYEVQWSYYLGPQDLQTVYNLPFEFPFEWFYPSGFFPSVQCTGSVALYDNAVVVLLDNYGLLALEQNTGEVRWAVTVNADANSDMYDVYTNWMMAPAINPATGDVIAPFVQGSTMPTDSFPQGAWSSLIWVMAINIKDGSSHSFAINGEGGFPAIPSIVDQSGMVYITSTLSNGQIWILDGSNYTGYSLNPQFTDFNGPYFSMTTGGSVGQDGTVWLQDGYYGTHVMALGCAQGSAIDPETGLCAPCPIGTTPYGFIGCTFVCTNSSNLFPGMVCYECPAGTFFSGATGNASTAYQCVPCPSGYSSVFGSVGEESCFPGTTGPLSTGSTGTTASTGTTGTTGTTFAPVSDAPTKVPYFIFSLLLALLAFFSTN